MARTINMAVLVVVVVAAASLLQDTAATTYIVGDSLGWKEPPGGSVAYSTWAASHIFTVGDTLVFNFTTGRHDVASVTMQAFVACNSTDPISLGTVGPTNVTLNSTGNYYFFCTFYSHCASGQKLAINVTASSSPTAPSPPPPGYASPPPPGYASPPPPGSAPTPSGTVTPSPPPPTYVGGTPSSPPPPSSAPSATAAAATFSFIFMSIALAFLF